MAQCIIDIYDLCLDATLGQFGNKIKESLLSCSVEISDRFNFDHAEFSRIVNEFNAKDFSFLINLHKTGELLTDHNSSALNERINGLTDELIQYGTGQNVSVYKTVICEYFENTTSLNSEDLLKFGTYSDVLSNSFDFWYPTSQGGQNNYAIFQESIDTNCDPNIVGTSVSGYRICWFCLALSDAAGTVAGAAAPLAATGGASAIPNPLFGGIPTAGVVGVIVGAGASVHSAINGIDP